jgi:hypothetical protein
VALSNLTLCYEAIQRVYRNAVVGHIRQTFVSAFPKDYGSNLKAPFAKEWDKIVASAAERRSTGELACEIKDDFDLLGVNHFQNIFEAQYDVLCPVSGRTTPEQRKLDRQVLLQWLKSVKNLRDPLSHPSEADFTFDDSFVLLDSARRVLTKLKLIREAEAVNDLRKQLSGGPVSLQAVPEALEDRLPSRESIVVDFVGRQSEIQQLWRWFNDATTRRWALAGEGGRVRPLSRTGLQGR